MQNREMRWRTPTKWGQRRNSLIVSRRQVRIKISGPQRTKANRTRKRSDHSTRQKALAKGKARRKSGPQEEQQERELETSLGTYLGVRARKQEREKLEANRATCLNIILFREQVRQPEPATLEQTGTNLTPESKGTEETWAETRRKCTPANSADQEVILANLTR